MPYKDPDLQRKYQREYLQTRRKKWFDANGPCIDCGSWNDLELDHANHKEKVSHRIWSWSESRREEELAKCVVRCRPCHINKTRDNNETSQGEEHGKAKLNSKQVIEIRRRYEAGGIGQRPLAKEYGISARTLREIVSRKIWKSVS